MRLCRLILLVISAAVPWANAAVRSAAAVMAEAQAAAAPEHKAIFVHFGASWCSYCSRLDGFLERPDVKTIFQKHFVIVKLDVMERDPNKALENPGAFEWFIRLGGPDALPFHAFVDAQGRPIINCRRLIRAGTQENIGFPDNPAEVQWFLHMVQTAAPRISATELATLESNFNHA